ncbi:efflux RND transporter permease subunit [Jeotgalibacillus haloalkalitolerans]|uniref:Efflux RND transporter permease subunit n=1 Tax=Jeotgalibacillus haloalkalitolerans TaxID=3104292 RepID=A0ABU5KNW6_9BACL|nr:efflux RND transporter permease subunit [Jeotgalibacillus sp. HH7-29]MDZ5712953.1 efflux RND transporter permease subunit [Jeotgalibacillus sp. HH7-29]
MNISRFSIRRPVFTIVTMLIVLLIGTISLTRIPLQLIPNINAPVSVVVTSYPGAGPTEVLEKVTKPIEAQVAQLPGLENVQSTSTEGSNLVLLEFNFSTDIDEVEGDIRRAVEQVQLPDDANQPRVLKFDPSQFPVIQMSLRSSDEETNIRNLAEELEVELSRTEGVASVDISNSLAEEVRISLDQDELQTFGLTQTDISNVIQANNVSFPGDTVETDGKSLTTRILSTLTSVEEIEDLVVSADPATGDDITLADVASVELGEPEQSVITRANDESAVLISVLQEADANTADVSTAFQDALNELLEEEQYESVTADVLFDQGDYIQLAIGNIASSLIFGGLFAMAVLFLFLRNIKSPIIIGVAIPYSVIVTFVLMYFADFSLNIFTLGALALGIGMLVDNAIVVLENIYRHLGMKKDPKTAARDGAKEVASAITASTLTTIAVFIPVVFIEGLIGDLFTEFALTISFSLFASLVVALTVIPMLASKMLKEPKEDLEKKRRQSPFTKRFMGSVKWSLRHRWVPILITFILLGAGGFGIASVGTQFLPATDEGFFDISVSLENGTALEETEAVISAIEDELRQEGSIEVYLSQAGSSGQGGIDNSPDGSSGNIFVKMKPLEDRDISVFELIEKITPEIEEAATSVNETAEVSASLQTATGTSPQTLSFSVRDTNETRLNESVDQIRDALLELNTITEVETDLEDTVEEVQIEINREDARAAGLSPAQISQEVNAVTRGALTTQIITDDSDVYDVYIQYEEEIANTIEGLEDLALRTPSGEFVTLSEVAEISIGEGPVSIQRIDQQAAVGFTASYTTNTNLGAVSQEVDDAIADLNLADETEVVFGGDRELLEDSIMDMLLAVGLAVVLVYFVMAAQFESFKYPFVIMFTVPLMVIGVAIAQFVTQTPVSVTSIIGLLILTGIVVNNGIVLVDYINQRKAAGMASYDAIYTSVRDRARPILMTALTTILGLVPLALGIGEGTEINQPMAITVIGGLISSTFLTLFIVPIVYSFLDPETRKMNKKQKAK